MYQTVTTIMTFCSFLHPMFVHLHSFQSAKLQLSLSLLLFTALVFISHVDKPFKQKMLKFLNVVL